MRYVESMLTFVYPVQNSVFNEIKELIRKDVNLCILLHTVEVSRRAVLFGINGLTATDA